MTEYYKVNMRLLEKVVHELDITKPDRTLAGLDLLYLQYKNNVGSVFDMQKDGVVMIGVGSHTIEDSITGKPLMGTDRYDPYVEDDNDPEPMKSWRDQIMSNTYYTINPAKLISRIKPLQM